MKQKTWTRAVSFLLLVAIVIGLIPAVFASDEASEIEPPIQPSSDEEAIVDIPVPTAEPEPSAIEDEGIPLEPDDDPDDWEGDDLDEDDIAPDDDWDFDDDWDGPRSDDGAPLTRNQIMLFAAAGSSATIGKSTCVSFPEYVSPYWYCNRYYTDGTHKYGHYFYASTISYHTVDGEYAFCVEPNTSSINGATYTSYAGNSANSTTYWMYELDATQRSSIQKILAFGYPQKTYGYSKQAEYAATQVLIWELVMRHRYADIQNASDYGLYYAVKSTLGNDLYYPYMAILGAISSGISNGKVPSFSGKASPSNINLTYNKSTKCYEANVTDSNAVLSYFTFSYAGVTFTKSGNSLKISVPEASMDSVAGKTITGTSSQKDMSTSNPTIWENSTYQTVLTNGGASNLKAYISLSYTPPPPETGTLKLVKRVSDSSISVSGWTFTIKNNSTGVTVTRTTDSNGTITVSDLDAGTYTVTEKAVSGYVTQPAQTVTLTAGSTSTVTFTNTPLKGNLTVQKSVNYGSLKGFQFRLYGTSTIGKSVDVTVSTDSSGVASFTGVYVGTYTLEELDPGKAYLPVSAKTVTISANATTGAANTATASFTNTYKYWNATVTKVDADTTTAQTDATLDGAEYTLYRNGTPVKTYTIQNGTFTTDSYPCTSSDSVYTLKETKAPTGYQLDATVYQLTTSYDHYTSASNNIKLTVSDKVITGNLQITKYAYNTVSKEQQPEKGAVFHVWLKSAGSYETAHDDMRDEFTIGDDGKGTSKNLPYGLYCVKQVSGWEGYDVDETTYEVRITSRGATVTTDTSGNKLEVRNNIWTGRLDIVKVDKDTREPLANALFTLTGSDGSRQTLGTGGDGKVFFENLVFGVTYTWEEIKAPHGYQLNENNKGTWTVGKHDDSITITCENQRRPGSISVLKQDADGNPLSGCTFLLEYLSGTEWKPVVSRSDGVITKGYTTTPSVTDGCLTTGAIGTVTFEGLYADDETKYRLTEVSAPEGYELLGKPVFEGTLPVEVDASTVAGTPDEAVGDTAYFYTLPITVRNGKSYVLPMTGGDSFPFIPLALFAIFMGAALYVYSWRRYFFRRAKHLIKNLY